MYLLANRSQETYKISSVCWVWFFFFFFNLAKTAVSVSWVQMYSQLGRKDWLMVVNIKLFKAPASQHIKPVTSAHVSLFMSFLWKRHKKNLISTAQSLTKLPIPPASSACNYLHIHHEKRTPLDSRAARGQDANWVRICSNGVKHSSCPLRQWVLTSNCIGLLMASRGQSSHKNQPGLFGFKAYWHGHPSYGTKHTEVLVKRKTRGCGSDEDRNWIKV